MALVDKVSNIFAQQLSREAKLALYDSFKDSKDVCLSGLEGSIDEQLDEVACRVFWHVQMKLIDSRIYGSPIIGDHDVKTEMS